MKTVLVFAILFLIILLPLQNVFAYHLTQSEGNPTKMYGKRTLYYVCGDTKCMEPNSVKFRADIVEHDHIPKWKEIALKKVSEQERITDFLKKYYRTVIPLQYH